MYNTLLLFVLNLIKNIMETKNHADKLSNNQGNTQTELSQDQASEKDLDQRTKHAFTAQRRLTSLS